MTSLDQSAARLARALSPAQWTAAASCLTAGYLIHLYAFTNLIPNADGLSRVFDPQQMTVSGRWFLHYASGLNLFTQMPALIGLVSLVLLSLAAALTVGLLGLNSRVLAGLTGVFMAAIPSLGYVYLYLFTASAYCLAILLAVLSVSLARRGGWWIVPGALALALSMGTYQAYASVAVTLSVLVVLSACLDEKATLAGTWRLGLSLAGCLILGAGLYYGILQLFLAVKDLELLDYLGMSQAGGAFPLSQLPRLVLSAYKQVIAYFLVPGSSNPYTTAVMVGLNGLLALAALVCLAARLGKGSPLRRAWRMAGGLAMLALLPLAMAFAQVISPYSDATPIMKYAFVLGYAALFLLMDKGLPGLTKPLAFRGACLCLGAGALGLALYQANINNLLYTASNQAHQATLSYATRLLSRIESCPGYTGTEEVVVIGAVPTDQIYAQVDSYALVDHYSLPRNSLISLNKHIYYYFNNWLNVPLAEPEEEVMIAVADSQAFADMPLYPADGSVAMVDGRVVVKLQEEYTPKSDYELAYENRR